MSVSPRSPIGSGSVGSVQEERSAPGRDVLPFRATTSHRHVVVLFRCSPHSVLFLLGQRSASASHPVRRPFHRPSRLPCFDRIRAASSRPQAAPPLEHRERRLSPFAPRKCAVFLPPFAPRKTSLPISGTRYYSDISVCRSTIRHSAGRIYRASAWFLVEQTHNFRGAKGDYVLTTPLLLPVFMCVRGVRWNKCATFAERKATLF